MHMPKNFELARAPGVIFALFQTEDGRDGASASIRRKRTGEEHVRRN